MTPTDDDYQQKILDILHRFPFTGRKDGPTALLGNFLYIGNYDDAKDLNRLEDLGITHILNCAAYNSDLDGPYRGHPTIVRYKQFDADDHEHYDIMRHFRQARTFINEAKSSGGRVLVHCAMGINRSGALCAAYIMCDQRRDLVDTVRMIKQKRGIVLVNRGFQRRLISFAREEGLLPQITVKR